MKPKITVLFLSILLMLLIWKNEMVQTSVMEGIWLCVTALIPSLLPFLLLSSLLSEYLPSIRLPFLHVLEKILHIPTNSGSIFLLGLLAGYPVGAQCICRAVEEGRLQPEEGRRMLCFCSNAGPSFIFGIGVSLFQKGIFCWLVWLTQLISALLVGITSPWSGKRGILLPPASPKGTLSFPQRPIATMAMICGWVISFRIMITFLYHSNLGAMPEIIRAILTGILELANGCTSLKTIQSEPVRFILFSAFLAFGGLCVAMQTFSISKRVHIKAYTYLPAKLCQSLLAAAISGIFWFLGFIN